MQQPDELANVTLIRHGLLGCSPVFPSVAISLDTLELYHRLRRRHPRLGVQAMTRALCDIHDVNYTHTAREHLSAAFDVYLNILRRTEQIVRAALGHHTEHWRIRNACHCCNLKLDGEPTLFPARLLAMDGNNSAKRVANAGTADDRNFTSNYFLSRGQVDHFKDEVKQRKTKAKPVSEQNEDDIEEDAPWITEDAPGEATDGQERPTPCTERWKASAAEHEKRALDIYDITGIFVSACRHGLIQKACEMVRSGELAKYPLAILSHSLDVHGDNCAFGYDIACAFQETAHNSPLVGPRVRELKTCFGVCAFHGYAHNRLCQLSSHPLYLKGFGIKDLETMERVFSSSNSTAPVIRYATPFHWMQALDLHFTQWDEDKYTELSRFLYNNYRQCLAIVRNYTPEVQQLKEELHITDADIEGWIDAERTFLDNLKDKPNERVLECAYVQALINRERADAKSASVRMDFIATPADRAINYAQDARYTLRLETARRTAMHELTVAIAAVGDLEMKLGIDEPWTAEHPKYQETLSYVRHRQFHRALDKVQQLVVQRLLELSKANMAGMGYKLRTSIGRAIKTRAQAIRTALKTYNSLAPQMNPPAPILEWKDIVNYAFISEFDILRHAYSHQDIISITSKYFKILRAQEEIVRYNVELKRLRTGIEVERREYDAAIARLRATDPLMAAELQERQRTRARMNRVHTARLRAIQDLTGFSGCLEMGVPVERGRALLVQPPASDSSAPAGDNHSNAGVDLVDGLLDADDTELVDADHINDMVRLADFVEELVSRVFVGLLVCSQR
ncbi:hypothetical protein BKA93DRAFT_815267 [Sparassis latifolia]